MRILKILKIVLFSIFVISFLFVLKIAGTSVPSPFPNFINKNSSNLMVENYDDVLINTPAVIFNSNKTDLYFLNDKHKIVNIQYPNFFDRNHYKYKTSAVYNDYYYIIISTLYENTNKIQSESICKYDK